MEVIERESGQKLSDFKGRVLSKISEFYDDEKDIKLKIINKLSDLSRQVNLVGWIRGDAVASLEVMEENHRLRREVDSWKSRYGSVPVDVKFPDLPDFFEITEISLLSEGHRYGSDVVAKVQATWADLFAVYYDSLQWGGDLLYWIDNGDSKLKIADNLLLKGGAITAATDVRVSDSDYRDCIALFEEYEFMNPVGEASHPFTDVGKKFARRARFSRKSTIRVEVFQKISIDDEIPF